MLATSYEDFGWLSIIPFITVSCSFSLSLVHINTLFSSSPTSTVHVCLVVALLWYAITANGSKTGFEKVRMKQYVDKVGSFPTLLVLALTVTVTVTVT